MQANSQLFSIAMLVSRVFREKQRHRVATKTYTQMCTFICKCVHLCICSASGNTCAYTMCTPSWAFIVLIPSLLQKCQLKRIQIAFWRLKTIKKCDKLNCGCFLHMCVCVSDTKRLKDVCVCLCICLCVCACVNDSHYIWALRSPGLCINNFFCDKWISFCFIENMWSTHIHTQNPRTERRTFTACAPHCWLGNYFNYNRAAAFHVTYGKPLNTAAPTSQPGSRIKDHIPSFCRCDSSCTETTTYSNTKWLLLYIDICVCVSSAFARHWNIYMQINSLPSF